MKANFKLCIKVNRIVIDVGKKGTVVRFQQDDEIVREVEAPGWNKGDLITVDKDFEILFPGKWSLDVG